MDSEHFKELLDELDGNSLETLKEKNARYSQNGDCLHNFRSGAEIIGGTPAQACWGYLTKHLVALQDMVNKNNFSNREDFLEKCQDTINYIRFLWCIGNDDFEDTKKTEDAENKPTEVRIFCKKDDSCWTIYPSTSNLRVIQNGGSFGIVRDTPFGSQTDFYSFKDYYATVAIRMKDGKGYIYKIEEKENKQ